MDGFFDHRSGTMRASEALGQLGCEFPEGSEIGGHALDFHRKALGLTDAGPVGFEGDPVGQLTLEGKRRLILLVAGPLYRVLAGQRSEKGSSRQSAWMAVEILKTLDDPGIKLKAIAIENVPAWEQDPEIPVACRAAAAKRDWAIQVLKVLTLHHEAAHARRRIIFLL